MEKKETILKKSKMAACVSVIIASVSGISWSYFEITKPKSPAIFKEYKNLELKLQCGFPLKNVDEDLVDKAECIKEKIREISEIPSFKEEKEKYERKKGHNALSQGISMFFVYLSLIPGYYSRKFWCKYQRDDQK